MLLHYCILPYCYICIKLLCRTTGYIPLCSIVSNRAVHQNHIPLSSKHTICYIPLCSTAYYIPLCTYYAPLVEQRAISHYIVQQTMLHYIVQRTISHYVVQHTIPHYIVQHTTSLCVQLVPTNNCISPSFIATHGHCFNNKAINLAERNIYGAYTDG